VSVCHIGLWKDHVVNLVNQTRLPLFEKCRRTTDGIQISTVKKSKRRTRWGKFTYQESMPM